MDWLGFSLAVLLIELTPGPNMGWLAALSMTDGRRAGMAATIGIGLGLALNGVLAAAGLAALVAADPQVWTALRIGGALLLLWLAWESWRDAEVAEAAPAVSVRHVRRYFAAGIGINLLNPKAFIFYVAVAPPFMGGRMPGLDEALTIMVVSTAIATLVHILIVLGAARAHGWMSDPRRTRTVRRLMALVMVGVAIWFLLGSGSQP